VEVKHNELGEIMTTQVDMATLRGIDPTLFASGPFPDDQSQSHLGWMPMEALKVLSQKTLGYARLHFGALCVSPSFDRSQKLARFGTQGMIVDLSILNKVLVAKFFCASSSKSTEVHVSPKCTDTWHRFGCPMIAWVSSGETLQMAKMLADHIIRRHHFDEIRMENEVRFLDLLRSTIPPLLCESRKEETELLMRLQHVSTALREEFCKDYVELIGEEVMKNMVVGKNSSSQMVYKLPLSIKFAEELQAALLKTPFSPAAKRVQPCAGSHSVLHYGSGFLCLHHLELMREAKGILFNRRTRSLKEKATKVLAGRLRQYYDEKEATEVQSLQELRAIIQNPITM